MSSTRVAVIQYPGTNCEFETARVAKAAGLQPEIFRWNQEPEALREFGAVILPGGFSYQDRIRAGAIAARKPLLNVMMELAEAKTPILGICNGAQVLVESGLVPGVGDREVQMALATNFVAGRTGYYCTWTTVKVTTKTEDNPFLCDFAEGDHFPLPIAHGEGRFITQNEGFVEEMSKWGQIALTYCRSDGKVVDAFPHNPNGSMGGAAGVMSKQGNVLALMPHPERCAHLFQLPDSYPHDWRTSKAKGHRSWEKLSQAGPGMKIFTSLANYLATH